MFNGLSMVIDMPTVTISLPATTEDGACPAAFGCAGVAGSAHQQACSRTPAQITGSQVPANLRSVGTYLPPPLSNLISDFLFPEIISMTNGASLLTGGSSRIT